MSCESCKNCKKGVYRDAFGSYPKYKYCPMCGEALTEPRPLTLDELRERDGMPVYLITNYSKRWVICGKYEWRQGHITEWQRFEGVGELPCEDYMEKTDHGWLAYDRPPKEGAHG